MVHKSALEMEVVCNESFCSRYVRTRLLPFLKPYARRSNIKDFTGKAVGVDAMCWMHKGAFSCSQELVQGQDTDKFVHYFLRMCEILRFNMIKPIIVFDGDKMPSKAKEDERRNEVREHARTQALELLKRREAGDHVDDRVLSSKCEGAIKVTSSMISRLQSALRELKIDFMVAPYEADAQLAYMCRRGWVHAVISEDSDLLAYGCPNTFFKMDRYGDGEHIALPCHQPSAGSPALPPPEVAETQAIEEQVHANGDEENADPNQSQEAHENTGISRGRGRGRGRSGRSRPKKALGAAEGDEKADKDIQLSMLESWSPEKFAQFCVFCGTDYKEHDIHIKGFGIKTAFKLMCKFSTAHAMLQWLVTDKKWSEKLPCTVAEYTQRYNSVVAVFWHHVVFDMRMGCVSIAKSFPKTEALRVLDDVDVPKLCGTGFPHEVAKQMVQGEIDPRSRKKREKEPLTPAERSVLDRMLAQKRADQREHQFQLSLKETAQRIAKEKAEKAEKEAAHQQAATELQDAEVSRSAEEPRHGVEVDQSFEDDGEDVPGARPDMTLFSGDAKRIMSLRDEVVNGKSEVEEMSTATEAPKSSNPFARKRSLTPGLSQSSSGKVVLPKRIRVMAAATVPLGVKLEKSVPPPEKVQRQIVKPELHKRGGFAAKDAASAVLAQRGVFEYAPLDASKDRSKLTSFFKVHKENQPSRAPQQGSKPEISQGRALAKWKARPWEEDEEEDLSGVIRENPLSLRFGRSNHFLARN